MVKYCLSYLATSIQGKLEKSLVSFVIPDGTQNQFLISLNNSFAARNYLEKAIKDTNVDLQTIFTRQCVIEWDRDGAIDSDFHSQINTLYQGLLEKLNNSYQVPRKMKNIYLIASFIVSYYRKPFCHFPVGSKMN